MIVKTKFKYTKMKAQTCIAILLVGGLSIFQAHGQKKEETVKKDETKVVVAPPAATWSPDVKISESMRGSMEAMKDAMGDIQVEMSDLPRAIYLGNYQEKTSSSLMLTKNFKEESISKKSTFDVEKGQRSISFSVNGNCDKGEIQVVIKDPSGKKLQEVVIDPSAQIMWSKTLSIMEDVRPERLIYSYMREEDARKEKETPREEPKIHEEYLGTWTIEVTAKNATGNYAVKIATR